jgi:DNA-binding response OmpR family regulator
LVEDDVSLLDMLRRTLERAGFTVITATEGNIALLRFKEAAVDAVVTDILLPGVDGFELIRRLKKESPRVPIVAMSGISDSPTFHQLAEKSGASIALSKPISRRQLVDALRNLLATTAEAG